MPTTIKAYAKINLTLDITGKRADGYHLLSMVMQSVSLCDELTLTQGENGIRVLSNRSDVPCDESNTVYRAAADFFEYAGVQPNVTIAIQKRIPSQAGLGGGSADAAAVLLALNEMLQTGYSKETLCKIGLQVGADVPFCIVGGTALAGGIGEKLTALPALPHCHIVICKPLCGVDTKKAYALADSAAKNNIIFSSAIVDAIQTVNLFAIAENLGNEFENVMNLAEVTRIKRTMKSMGALGACMTGSGSAVFGIFDHLPEAAACETALSKDYDDVFLCEPVNMGSEKSAL
ncbi:MAG: ispE [Caproiciproducens sp.]|jgi:4-diphosphocytidyl-2-C-methyl-D-erythritol kinase|nr:ispE [Caproiciproducens sp.]